MSPHTRGDRIDSLLRSAARHLEDATVPTPLCLHAKQCPQVKKLSERSDDR